LLCAALLFGDCAVLAQQQMSIYRQTSVDSDGFSDGGNDTLSVVSESFELERQNEKGRATVGISGYLLKQSQDGDWQKRYFETNGMFLTYYKSKKRNKLLAALNVSTVGAITLVSILPSSFYLMVTQIGHIDDTLGKGVVFQLELKDRNYTLRTKDLNDAERWINGLTKLRSEAREISTIVEESPSADHDDHRSVGEDDQQPLRPVEVESSTSHLEKGETAKDGDWEKNPERRKQCCVLL
jgi:hypothetical protein